MALDEVYGAPPAARSSGLPTRSTDVVAIVGPGFTQLFERARPLTASVTETAEVMEHPLETGAVIIDHIIFKPVEIELPLVCAGEDIYRSVYADIKSTYLAGTLLTIQTRTGTYANMVLMELPHDETPDAFNAITLRVRFREAQFTPSGIGLNRNDVANPSQSSTVRRGNQQTSGANARQSAQADRSYKQSGTGPAPKTQGSTLNQWFGG